MVHCCSQVCFYSPQSCTPFTYASVAGITSSSLNRVFIFPVFIAILNARVHGKYHGQVTRLIAVKPTPLLEPLVGLAMSTSRFQTTYTMPIKSSLMLKQSHTKTSPSVHCKRTAPKLLYVAKGLKYGWYHHDAN